MGTSETLRSVIEAGSTSRRLDELSAARVIGKAAQQVHAAQQKAGAGKAIGPITPAVIELAPSGAVTLTLPATSTLAYSAPEIVNGGSGDRRSDVFSLGIALWEALTHARLFDAMNDAAVKAAVNEREIMAPSEINANIPAELSAICMRALARNPADRYQSAKSMAVEIEEFLEEAGYADSDEQIATYLADLAKAKPDKKAALPPPTRSFESKTPPPPPAAGLPSVLTAPTQPPSVLKSNTTPPPTGSPGAALASALANAGGTVTAPTSDKTTTAPGMGPSVLVTPAPAANARTANGTAPPPQVPAPPVLPTNGEAKAEAPKAPVVPANGDAKADPAKINPGATTLGIGAMTHAPAPPTVEAKPVEQKTSPATPAAIASQPAPRPPVVPATAKAPDEAAPVTPMGRAESRPNPADVVALPHRDSKGNDVLAGWGWGTDSHQAITDDEFDTPHQGSNRKLLLYLLGGGLVFTIMVAVIAFGFGGSKKKKGPPPAAATSEWNGSSQPGSAQTAMAGSATTPDTTAGSSDTGSAMAGSAAAPDTGSAIASGSATTPDTGSATAGSAAGSAMAATGTTPGSAAVATTGPVNPYPDTPDTTKPDTTKPDTTAKVETPKTTKTETPKVETPKTTKTETPKTAKVETPKTTKKVETPKATKTAKVETPKTTKTETPKVDVEQAYRVGLQQFARGDTTGALASLRTSLAGNPNYAPTWRGLGLVFEKLGEKDQARAAYKRYLQLAPNAGDAENIHSRLERLGS